MVRDVITGSMALTPSMVASRTTASILSPLSTAWTSVRGMPRFGSGCDGLDQLDAHTPADSRRHSRMKFPAAPVEDGDSSPVPSLIARVR